MSTQRQQNRVLFVDDEASIRLTLPRILQERGFEVRTAGSVSEALVEINRSPFDVLISDLNIGEEGDGFLVVSAMRHLQPDCVNFILTGYPAFETALQAIHNQVDDYLVKPIDIDALVNAVTAKLVEPGSQPSLSTLSSLLRDNPAELTRQLHSRIQELCQRPPMTKPPHASDLDGLLDEVMQHLQANRSELRAEAQRQLADYGKRRAAQGCTVLGLTRDFHALRISLHDMLQSHLVHKDVPALVSDLNKVEVCIQAMLERALEGLLSPQN